MNNTRFWIVVLALVSFLAGSAAGALWTRKANPQEDTGPFAAYAQELIQTFDLSPERAGHLRVLLREYESDIQRIKQARIHGMREGARQAVSQVRQRMCALTTDAVRPG